MSHNGDDLTLPLVAVLHQTLAVVNLTAVRFLVAALTGWLNHDHEDVVAYLVEENRTLRAQSRGRLFLTDDERGRLAVRTSARARTAARGCDDCDARHDSAVASGAHRAQMDVHEGSAASSGVLAEIRRLVVRMAEENST